ncbi:hypothetical protein RHSIM_Rhsim04G0042400 [Rhododendron simsii]|uniref:BED-type domain-containing protein n=1 Tax=Rhododendron simsii TaxID=118357 RepID=A0A834H3W2_RHOSS|nr:hypothetical protein RHSIM_Rhsim08G0107700 [Rhododendron simsii]KAF7146521.1 hypothetical protein RHSIM_Rhsim04G0042400 [Rhododendron simsii]
MDPEHLHQGGRDHSDSESSDSSHDEHEATPSISPPQMGSIGEAGSNIVAAAGSTATGTCGAKKRRLTSYVWEHFQKVENFIDKHGISQGKRAVCNYCGSDFSCNSNHGTGSTGRHFKNIHKKDLEEGRLGSSGPSGGLSKFKYSKPKMREGLARYVAAAEQPFTFGDDIRFEYFVKNYLNPEFSKVSRNTTRSDCLGAFGKTRKEMITEIKKFDSTISFTSDMWSGINNLGYICVTAHYIDSSWILNKRIIAFRLMEHPHNANQIFQCISGVFREFEIVDKVFSITFDNHTANSAAIELFKVNMTNLRCQFFHMRCVCHIINLVVQDGLESIAPQIKNIRNALLFIATSGVRQQEFDALCKSYNVKPKRMKTDMKIRWNSTFLMLKSCRKHTDVITAFVNAKSNCSLTHSDWIIAFEFMKFLKVFYAATCALSGVRYPTSCLVLNHLYNISFTFNTYRTETNFVAACINMESKFKKYFKDMPKIFIVAAVMDPRIKLDAAQMLLDGISVNLMITLPSLTEVNSLLTNLYASYESKFASTTMATSVTSVPLPSTSSNDPSWSLISKKGKSASARSELVKYLEIERLTENNDLKNFDILDWWKKNERTFPILSIMARDVLTAPVSSVASESAFSAGKRVLDEKRSRLAPDILDCLLCLKDWEDARLGIQKRSAKDEFRDYFSDSDIDGDD